MKCMTQMPVPPIAHAARISQPARPADVGVLRTRAVQISPSSEPRNDNA